MFFALVIASFFVHFAVAQDTVHHNVPGRGNPRADTIRLDTSRRKTFDISLFADSNTLTSSDYLVHIEKVYQTLNKVPVLTGSFNDLSAIAAQLDESDTALSVIKGRLSSNDRTLNLRNLQMYYIRLEAIQATIRNTAMNWPGTTTSWTP